MIKKVKGKNMEEIGKPGNGSINGYRCGKKYFIRDPKNKKLIHFLNDNDNAYFDNESNLVIDRRS